MKWTLLQTQSNQWFFNNLLFSPSNSVYDVYPAIIQLFSIPREPAARFYKLDSQSDGTLLLMCEVSHSITHSAAWLHCTQAHSMESRCWLNVQTSKSLRHPPPYHHITTVYLHSSTIPIWLRARKFQVVVETDGNPERGLEEII